VSAVEAPATVVVRPSVERRVVVALALLFFCSGASALIYQVLWTRMFGWVFGVTVHAASAVWATYMAGLAVGSLAAGRLGDRLRVPMRWFGATELLIAATALASPSLLGVLQQAYVALHPAIGDAPAAVTTVRLGIAFAVLLVPTALMGATLPLVIRSATFRQGPLGGRVGFLYGSNAAGAIAGTLVAGLHLIPQLGLQRSFLVAAALNACAGAGALALSTVVEARAAGAEPRGPGKGIPDRPDWRRRVVLIVFTLSGFVTLALEVVWFRVLTLFLRPTVYGFALMLAAVLAGITLGSYIAAAVLRQRRDWLAALAGLQLATAAGIVLSCGPLVYLAAVSERITPAIAAVLPEYLAYPMAGSLLTIFPTALLMGIAFPIGLHAWTAGGDPETAHTAERVGLFYSLNVAGAIVGSLAAGFLLLPVAGSRTSLILLGAITCASGLALAAASSLRPWARGGLAAGGLAVFAVAVGMAPDPFALFVAHRYPGQQVVWRAEAPEATVVVHERQGELSLTVNGNHEASTGPGMTYVHRRIGHLPLALHPDPRTALVIGLGGGATAGAASRHDGVFIDIVELSAAVVQGARFFEAINHGVLDRPHVSVRIDDGRNYLMLTSKRYDVITADVILPIWAGSGNLYSVEYFELMRRALRPGGLVLQWVAGTEAEYKLIARTFLSVFPHTTVWGDGTLLVGSTTPLRLRRGDFEWKLQVPGRAAALAELGTTRFEDLLAAFVAGPDELRAFVGPGPLLTDDRPLTEYFLSLPRNGGVDLSRLRGDVSRFVETE
jgi:spermidine synthase